MSHPTIELQPQRLVHWACYLELPIRRLEVPNIGNGYSNCDVSPCHHNIPDLLYIYMHIQKRSQLVATFCF